MDPELIGQLLGGRRGDGFENRCFNTRQNTLKDFTSPLDSFATLRTLFVESYFI